MPPQDSALASRIVAQVVERFEQAWQSGQVPSIEDFLTETAVDQRLLLLELLYTDLEYRLNAGHLDVIEVYLARFPALGSDVDNVMGLIQAEFRWRCHLGHAPEREEYVRRFPHYERELAQLLAPAGDTAGPLTSVGCKHEIALAKVSPNEGQMPMVPGYEILEKLAEGGMGVVYKALQIAANRIVALKMIRAGQLADRDDQRRFRREAQAAARLQHPHIVQVFEVGEHAGQPFFSLEYCSGGGLDRKLNGTPLPPAQAAAVVEKLARAMAPAHAEGILHRDLKPGNVLFDAAGEPKIADFGLAKRIDEVGLTQSGVVVGTASYMPPEQARGKVRVLGPACDIYALGAILYECLTGRPPFKAASTMETLLQVIHDDPVPPRQLQSKLPPDAETICLKCLRKEPDRRYSSVLTLADDLRRFQTGEPIEARPIGMVERTLRWCRRKPALAGMWAALTLLLCSLVAGAFWYVQDQAQRQADRVVKEARATQQRLLAEQGIRQALEYAEGLREDLEQRLRKPGGVFLLLNHPENWEAQIKIIQATLDRARVILSRGEHGSDTNLDARASGLQSLLDRDERGRKVAMRLDKVYMDRISPVEGKFENRRAAEDYLRIFAEAGFDIHRENVITEIARRMAGSSVNEKLVAALDDWAIVAYGLKETTLCQRLLDLARQTAPDPEMGDRIRQIDFWRDKKGLHNLLKAGPTARLSPQLLTFVGEVAKGTPMQEAWLRQAQTQYPGDFLLNLVLANAIYRSDPAEAAGYCWAAIGIRPLSSIAYNSLGNVLSHQKKLTEAIAAYRKAIDLDPKDAIVYSNLGGVLRDQKKLPEAVAACQKAIDLDPKLASAYSNFGNALRDQKKLPEAIAAFQKAIDLNPEFALAYYNLGNALHDQKKLPEAIAAFQKAIDHNSAFAAAYSNLGNSLHHYKKPREAIAACQKAIDLDPKYAPAYNNLGSVLLDQMKLADAIAAYQKAIGLDPNSATVYGNLGAALGAQKKFTEAIAAFQKALELDPKDAVAHYNLGKALHDQKKLSEAIAAYQKAIDLDPQLTTAYYHLGGAFRACKKLPEAIAAFQKAIDLNPKDAAAYGNLGIVFLAQKKHQEAVTAFQKAIEVDPKSAAAYSNLGAVLRDQKKLSEAIVAFQKAIDLDPSAAAAYYNLGITLREQKRLPEAIVALQKAIALDAKNAEAYNNLGSVLSSQKKLPEAITAYQKAIDLDPGYAAAYNNLGVVLHDQKKLTEAIAAYKKAVHFNPKDAKAYTNLGIALYDQKKLAEAINAYEKAVEAEPEYAKAYTNLGVALRDQNKLTEAIAAYQKAVDLNPKEAKAYDNLGSALREQKKLSEAVAAFQKAIDLDPKYAAAHSHLAITLHSLKKLPEAMAAFQKAVDFDPKDAMAYYNLGIALRAQNKLLEATAAYRKAIDLKPNLAMAYCNLGHVLKEQGDFAKALDAMAKGHELGGRTPGWPYPSGAWVKECTRLLELDKGLSLVLQGKASVPARELLAMAQTCQDYGGRHATAVRLYNDAFKAQPRLLEDPTQHYAYLAAHAAVLASTGKDKEGKKLTLEEKAQFRNQAHSWLRAELALVGGRFTKAREDHALQLAVLLEHWLGDSIISAVREVKELDLLPQDERESWLKLWAEVRQFLEDASAHLRDTRQQGTLRETAKSKAHPLAMSGGKLYVIDLESTDFDAFLRLEDTQGRMLAENDDIAPENRNARIIFAPGRGGTFRIIVTSFQEQGIGRYTLRIREGKAAGMPGP